MVKIKCLKCNKELEGDKQGTFIKCDCKGNKFSYIDEVEEYCRIGYVDKSLLMVWDTEKKKWKTLEECEEEGISNDE